MKILKRILFILAVLLLIITAIGLLLPSRIHVERTTFIDRPQLEVFNYVNDITNWNSWSPWFEMDTTASYTVEGTQEGKGARINWVSTNKDVGRGSMTYVEVEEPEFIKQDLVFMEEGIATGVYVLKPEGTGTSFFWSFEFDTGFNPLLRILGLFMDGMVGKDFEKGLAKLKTVLENSEPENDAEIIPSPIPDQDSL